VIARRSYALAALIAVMIVWGSTFVITKAAVREIPPWTLAALRFLIALVVLVPFAIARGGLACLPRPLPIGALLAMGVTGISVFAVGFNLGLYYASASQGALIFALIPAAVAGAAVIALKERISRRRALGILLSVAGVGWVAVSGQQDTGSPNPLLGAVCMLSTVFAWAVYTVVAKKLADADQVVVLTVITAMGALILVPFAALELMQGPRPMPSLQAWVGTVYLGVVGSAVAYLVYNVTLRQLDASLVGALTNLDPIVGLITAVLFLGESLGGGQIAGGLIALIGMWLAS
jgi:drug/metabolite transporter (DMT)-like permease